MIQARLYRELEKVAARRRRVRLRIALSITWLLAAGAGAGALALGGSGVWYSPWTPVVLAGCALVTVLVCGFTILRTTRDYRPIARLIEARNPDLAAGLLAAVEQKPQFSKGRFGYLQTTVIRQVLSHSRQHSWREAV